MSLLETKLKDWIVIGGLATLISGCRGCRIKQSPYFSFTDEQLLWTGNYADPSVIQYGGRFLMYLNTFVDTAGYLVFSSNDGLLWTQESDLLFPGIATARAFVFPDGVRFYYPVPSTEEPGTELREIVSAFSSDGLSFEEEAGVRISPAEGYSAWGPTVIQLPNDTYRMFFTEGNSSATHLGEGVIYGASSTDGVTWTRDENITLEAEEAVEGPQDNEFQAMHPFALPWSDGFLLFYTSHLQTFAAYSDDSHTWTKLGSVGIPGESADIDGHSIDDKTMRIYFGRFSEETGGEVYTTLLNINIPTE